MRPIIPIVLALTCTPLASTLAAAQNQVVVAVPAQAGAVNGMRENSDAFVWRKFTEFVAPASNSGPSPVQFETWASDADTFSKTPHWPSANEPRKFQASVLERAKRLPVRQLQATAVGGPIDVGCKPPLNPAIDGFPAGQACIAEQVYRNRVEFDYIENNKLNTQAGLAAAFAKSFDIDMPIDSIAIKVDWVPVQYLAQWIPQAGDTNTIRKSYYTTTDEKGVEYAVVSMHVASRQNPNWVWGTFEHHLTPGRCDYIGCFDTFGAQIPAVPPNKNAFNTQYGACPKTEAVKQLMAQAKLSPVWENYCMKSTQVDFNAGDGTPYVLGNSVIEGLVGNGTVAASSCISCHSYASFGPQGQPLPSVTAILPFNPTGKTQTEVLAGSRTFSFQWGVLLVPPR